MRDYNGSRLTGLTCSKVPGFWMVEHQLVIALNHTPRRRIDTLSKVPTMARD